MSRRMSVMDFAKSKPIDAQAVAEERYRQGFAVTGDTYPIKDELKRAGCLWHAERKVWVASSELVRDRMQKLVPGANVPEVEARLALYTTEDLVAELRRRGVLLQVELRDEPAPPPVQAEERKQATFEFVDDPEELFKV